MADKETFETFQRPTAYYINNLKALNKPACFNGSVYIRRYRVTVELIGEPKEVYEERLRALWDNTKNIHHWDAIKREASRLGLKRFP